MTDINDIKLFIYNVTKHCQLLLKYHLYNKLYSLSNMAQMFSLIKKDYSIWTNRDGDVNADKKKWFFFLLIHFQDDETPLSWKNLNLR